MPELPEVETVKETLKRKILNKKIIDALILYPKIIEYPATDLFKKQIINQTINDIQRRGKWLMFVLDDYYLFSHLRMEGKYNLKNKNKILNKHDHIIFKFIDDTELRYNDTRKFGRMLLLKKQEAIDHKPLNKLGLEPFSDNLSIEYLRKKFKNKKLPIKSALLDQSIITGIGNIYADEILFLSKVNPKEECNKLSNIQLENIIANTNKLLKKAISLGGTTIHSFTSEEGITGLFQRELLVHTKSKCIICNSDIIKIKIGGRGTYYCPKCQKK